MKPKVLIVDDEELSPAYLENFLGDQFTFEYAGSGEAALVALAAGNPAVILMDVEMPGGMNGYQACRAIKDNKATQGIPVFFISAHSMAEDRLKAYESGGDDYVSKPFNTEEIRHKITLALTHQGKRIELAEKALRATNVAMMSIREAANTGTVLGFLSDIIRQTDLAEIAAITLYTLQKFRIEGAVQLRDGRGHLSRNSAGTCTPVEDAVLTKMASDNRIVDLGNRSAFNYERATIIVYDMPLHDPELYGRLKDTVVKMAEALDIHLRSLDGVAAAVERGDRLIKLLQHNAGLSRDISTRLKAQRDENHRALKHLSEGIERAAAAGQTDVQKQQLQNLARDALVETQTAIDRSIELEKMLDALCAAPEEASPKDTRAVASDGNARFNNVELF
ncbi:MAG TPA: response regulator [Burkholderiales bacterium]|nr:response regulator [Burkholderiales bacterium]